MFADPQRISWLINSIDMDDQERGWSLQRGTSPGVARTIRRSPLVLHRSHGARATSRLPVYDEAQVSMRWLLRARNGSLRATYDDLAGVLSAPTLRVGLRNDGQVIEAPAELQSLTEPTGFMAGTHTFLDATFALSDPFLRDQQPHTTGVLAAGTHLLPGLTGTAPVNDSVIRFSGATSQVSITDQGSGTGLTWTGTVNSNQYLFIHPLTMTARRGGSASAWESGGTDLSGALDYPGRGRLQLWPIAQPAGGHRIQITTAGAPAMIRGKRAWL